MNPHYRRLFAVFAVCLLAGLPLLAQTTAALTGNVSSGGSPLPGVTVTILSPSMQGTRTTVTNINGDYNFGALPPGEYTVKFELESMQTVTRTARIGVSQTGRADAQLQVSALAEAITVTASSSPTAALETTQIATNLDAKLIENLPLARTIIGTISLAPGVNQGGPANAVVISGAPSYENVFMVNGAVVQDNLRGSVVNLFIEDAIQETTVLTGGISAEYGRFTGGVVSAITKSGGNQFSGSLRDSLTNPSFTSKTAFDTSEHPEPDPIDVNNQVDEATLGGRVIRDRLWFFGAGRYNKLSASNTILNTTINFTTPSKEKRYEGKLTGQITPKHSVVGSYLDVKFDQTNYCFFSCEEASAYLGVNRQRPMNLKTFHYNGIITSNFLLEGQYSRKYALLAGDGGPEADLAHGTNVFDANQGSFYGAPTFCSTCGGGETRNNDLYGVKGTYYLSSKSLGTSSIVAGYEHWAEQRKGNNFQSGSNYTVYTYSEQAPADANGVLHPILTAGDLIIYYPILESSKGSNFETESFFVNDKWDFNNHFTFNLGVRYDTNSGVDSSKNKVVDDSNISPRLGLVYDVFGNSRLRLNASYSKYVARIADTVAGAGSGAGNPSYIYWQYNGPTINAAGNLTTPQALAQLFANFAQTCPGFTTPTGGLGCAEFAGSTFQGLNTRVGDNLKSPNLDEFTVGAGTLIGKGFLRGDYIHRDWKDFYVKYTNLGTGQVTDPAGNHLDVGIVGNSDDLERKYEAISMQFNYPLLRKVNVGLTYTYSKLEGNVTSETSGSGPITEGAFVKPEYKAFAQNNPVGYLSADVRNRARAWASYDLPTAVGKFNFSVLERLDDGAPFSAVGTIDVRKRASLPQGVVNPGYASAVTSVNYFFSKRGQYNFDRTTATDLALNYELPISKFGLFVQGELINAFNEQAQIAGDTTVLTTSNGCVQTSAGGANAGKACLRFNPIVGDVPVEGVNFRLGSNFGGVRNGNDFQLPLTYRFSVGLKF